jgi:hypothetical protein
VETSILKTDKQEIGFPLNPNKVNKRLTTNTNDNNYEIKYLAEGRPNVTSREGVRYVVYILI